MRHFAHNIGDYAAATAHLTFIEDAAYHRLLRRYYQDERPLPRDVGECQRLVGARSRAEKAAVVATLQEFFVLTTEGWTQGRADREIATFRQKVEIARTNGTKGGRRGNPQQTQPVPEKNQQDKLPTPHSPPSVSKDTGSDPAAVIFREGLAWLVAHSGRPESECRSQLGKWRKAIGDAALIEALGAGQREGAMDGMGFMEKAVAARVGGPKRKPWEKPPQDALPPQDPWEKRVSDFRKDGFWLSSQWGPPPGQPGCRAPRELWRAAA